MDDSLTEIQWLPHLESRVPLLPLTPKNKGVEKPIQRKFSRDHKARKPKVLAKPDCSFVDLICAALCSTKPSHTMRLQAIYNWIEQNSPYYQNLQDVKWKTQVRYHLTKYKKLFQRLQFGMEEKPYHMWTLLDVEEGSKRSNKALQQLNWPTSATATTTTATTTATTTMSHTAAFDILDTPKRQNHDQSLTNDDIATSVASPSEAYDWSISPQTTWAALATPIKHSDNLHSFHQSNTGTNQYNNGSGSNGNHILNNNQSIQSFSTPHVMSASSSHFGLFSPLGLQTPLLQAGTTPFLSRMSNLFACDGLDDPSNVMESFTPLHPTALDSILASLAWSPTVNK